MTDGPQYPEYPEQPRSASQPQPPPQPSPSSDQPPPSYGSAPQWPPPPPGYGQQPAYGQPPAHPGYGYGYQPPRTNQMAVWAMVVGIVSIVFCYVGVLIGPVAIGLGVSARRRIAERQGAETGEGMALAGLITGIVGTVIWGGVIALLVIGLASGF